MRKFIIVILCVFAILPCVKNGQVSFIGYSASAQSAGGEVTQDEDFSYYWHWDSHDGWMVDYTESLNGQNNVETGDPLGDDDHDGISNFDDSDWEGSENYDQYNSNGDADHDGIQNHDDHDWLYYPGVLADHSLPAPLLPPSNTSNVQLPNLCVFKTLEWIGKYLGSTRTEGPYLLFWMQYPPGHSNVTTVGFDGTIAQLEDIINHFFVATAPCNDIHAAIDAGHAVFGTIANPPPATDEHAVFITGYNDDGTVVYFNPETGTYQVCPETDILYAIEISAVIP